MASTNQDPLSLFRSSLGANTLPIPTKSEDPSSATDAVPLQEATYLVFNIESAAEGAQHIAFPCTTPTRFVSPQSGVLDILSTYFCWQNKDKSAGEYIAATTALNTERSKAGLSSVVNLVFAEKLDLVNWLSGDVSEHESEFIKSLDDNKTVRGEAQDAADLVGGDGDIVMGEAGDNALAKGGRREEERLREIYALERKLGDRNTVLRGSKPTDFSQVRKYTELFLRSSRTKQAQSGPTPALNPSGSTALRSNKPSSSRRPDQPIILLSPSASSLLRLSNIKSFLVDGNYTPPSSSSGLNMLQLQRLLPSIDANRPLRFILVETPENFKPDYWNRVVAVFTTGQAWQFKGYKWSHPADLFSHALGVYVGWRNEGTPEAVKAWGRGVLAAGVDYYREGQTERERWRDRETVEEIWGAIETSMRARGWGKSV